MIQSIRGTKDLLPETSYLWHFVESKFREISALYGYEELRSPIFEKTEVFSRGIGEGTDIVNKEMYTFTDRGGDSLTLRPEGTAGLVRAVLQNGLIQQSSVQRLWYFGPFFRYERPQKGRLRQFHQYGAECISSPYPESDVEVILLADSIFKALGIKDYKLLINTLGTKELRKRYRDELTKYLTSYKDELSEDSKYRLEVNPLRVLDSKDEKDKRIIENAPDILTFLDDVSTDHFETVKSLLTASGLKYEIQPRLVRGLDYYNHTVFEFQSDALGAQDSFGGGGRYDNLFEELGGKPAQAVGFALGVERLLLIMEHLNAFPARKNSVDVFVVTYDVSLYETTLNIAGLLRKRNIGTSVDLLRRSMKAQFKESNKLQAKYTIVVAKDELVRDSVTIKNMETSEQQEVLISELEKFVF